MAVKHKDNAEKNFDETKKNVKKKYHKKPVSNKPQKGSAAGKKSAPKSETRTLRLY